MTGLLKQGLAICFMALAVGFVPAGAQGQDGSPRSILPETPVATDGVDQNPFQSATPANVEITDLEAARLGGIGLLSARNGGFPRDLWQNSYMPTVLPFLEALPVDARPSFFRDLIRRLVVTAALPPKLEAEPKLFWDEPPLPPEEGVPGEAADAAAEVEAFFNGLAAEEPANPQPIPTDQEFVAVRLAKLQAMGDLDGIASFLGQMGRDITPDLRPLAMDVHLLAGQNDAACYHLNQQVPEETSADWLKFSIFCRLVDGDVAGASLAHELLGEIGPRDDAFEILISAYMQSLMPQEEVEDPAADAEDAAGPQVLRVESLPGITPLHLALARLAGAELPADTLTDATPLMEAALAGYPKLDMAARLQAATDAARRGGFAMARLRSLYEAAAPEAATPAESVEDPEVGGEAAAPAEETEEQIPVSELWSHRLAAHYRTLAQTTDVAEKLNLVMTGIGQARAEGDMGLYARLVAPLIPRPVSGAAGYAIDMVSLLVEGGEADRVYPWYQALSLDAAAGDMEAGRARQALWPLMVLLGAPDVEPVTGDNLSAWVASLSTVSTADRGEHETLVFMLFEALGHHVPEAVWGGGETLDGTLPGIAATTESETADLRRLSIAAAEGRKGEVLLRGLHLLGIKEGGDLRQVTPVRLAHVVRALKIVGLEREARDIAVAALMARGL